MTEKAIKSQLFDTDIKNVKKALLIINSGFKTTVTKTRQTVKNLISKFKKTLTSERNAKHMKNLKKQSES